MENSESPGGNPVVQQYRRRLCAKIALQAVLNGKKYAAEYGKKIGSHCGALK